MQRKILLTAWWRVYCDWQRRRQAIAELEAFSDRELNDIGVRRSEIDSAVRHGIWRRPLPKAKAQVQTAEAPAPVAPREMRKQGGKDIPRMLRSFDLAHPGRIRGGDHATQDLAHTYRRLNTCLGGASWRLPVVNRLDREVECYGPKCRPPRRRRRSRGDEGDCSRR